MISIMKNIIPQWTHSDLEKAREHAESISGSGSTTALLDRHNITHKYSPGGVVYVDAEELNAAFHEELGEFLEPFVPFNDKPGPHPWQAEIHLKKCFKKLFDFKNSQATIPTCQSNKSPCLAPSAEKIQPTE